MFKVIKNFINKKTLMIFLIAIATFGLTGCSTDTVKTKLGFKNSDFEYIKQNKIEKIVIQNKRDPGYRFIVTDRKTIQELYDILSSAREAKEKSSLDADYTFEMYEDHDKVHKFHYIVGLDKKNGGNLYGDGKVYIVSKRIDNDIIKSFWSIRIPKDFTYIYYNSILEVLDKYMGKDTDNKKVGINLYEDIDIQKFILSTDLENFKSKLSSKYNNVELIQEENSKYDVVITIKTQGYKRLLYKSMVTVYNRQDKSEKKYYFKAEYKNRKWTMNVYDKKPKGFN